MTNETPEVPGQQTIDESQETATELLQEGGGPTPEADALDARDAKKDEDEGSEEDEPAEPDPTVGSDADAGDSSGHTEAADPEPPALTEEPDETEHLFRVTHQMHNAGNPNPHSTVTSEATDAATAVKWLATRVHDIQPLIDALKALL